MLPGCTGNAPRLRLSTVALRRGASSGEGSAQGASPAVRSRIRSVASACFACRRSPSRARPKNAKASSPSSGTNRIISSHAIPTDGLRLPGMIPIAAMRSPRSTTTTAEERSTGNDGSQSGMPPGYGLPDPQVSLW